MASVRRPGPEPEPAPRWRAAPRATGTVSADTARVVLGSPGAPATDAAAVHRLAAPGIDRGRRRGRGHRERRGGHRVADEQGGGHDHRGQGRPQRPAGGARRGAGPPGQARAEVGPRAAQGAVPDRLLHPPVGGGGQAQGDGDPEGEEGRARQGHVTVGPGEHEHGPEPEVDGVRAAPEPHQGAGNPALPPPTTGDGLRSGRRRRREGRPRGTRPGTAEGRTGRPGSGTATTRPAPPPRRPRAPPGGRSGTLPSFLALHIRGMQARAAPTRMPATRVSVP